MANLSTLTINDSEYIQLPRGTTAQRPSTGTVSVSTQLPLDISANGLFLKNIFNTFYNWSYYQNLPEYLTGLVATTTINFSASFTVTLSHACRVYLIADSTWTQVDRTGYTTYETNKDYIFSYANVNVYYRDFTAGSYTFNDTSAMYMFDFGSNVNARKGMMRFNTDSQCTEWFNGLRWVNDIVRSGLICYVDAANKNSWGGLGVTLRDISGNGRHFIANATPTTSPTYYGTIQLSSSQFFRQTNLNLAAGTSTIMAAARYYSAATPGRIISAAENNWLLGHWGNTVQNYFAEGWVTAAGNVGYDSNWRIYAGTANTVADTYNLYVNGTLTDSNSNGSQGPNQLQINGHIGGTGESSTAEFSWLLAYNRVLNAAEVLQNYNAFRYRFGL